MTTRRKFILGSATVAGVAGLPAEGTSKAPKGATSCEESRPSRDEERIAEAFVRARLETRLLTRYPGSVPLDFPSAYRCQDAAIVRWPRPVAGWKVAGRFMPTQDPIFGPAFEGRIYSAATGQIVECPVIVGGMGGFEPEVVVRVGRDAPPGQTVWRLVEAAEMVGELCIGGEVTNSPLPTIMQNPVPAVVADFCGCGGIVIGQPIPNWQTLEEITASVYVGDKFAHRATRPVRDGILEVFRSTLAHCARRRYPLRAGMVITTGGLATPVGVATLDAGHIPSPPGRAVRGVQAGETVRAVFDGIGEFTCRTVAATPHA